MWQCWPMAVRHMILPSWRRDMTARSSCAGKINHVVCSMRHGPAFTTAANRLGSENTAGVGKPGNRTTRGAPNHGRWTPYTARNSDKQENPNDKLVTRISHRCPCCMTSLSCPNMLSATPSTGFGRVSRRISSSASSWHLLQAHRKPHASSKARRSFRPDRHANPKTKDRNYQRYKCQATDTARSATSKASCARCGQG